MPETSIIIRAFNEERHLPVLLDGLAAQSYRDFEIIVVDSGSFDHTRQIASERTHRLVRLTRHDFTFGHSLNVGIQASEGRFLAIVSAHTVPAGMHWLEELIKPLRDGRTAMVYGRQSGDDRSKFSEQLDFQRTFGVADRILTPPDFFANNANSAIRRDLWEKHPFDETLPGLEDIEWAKHWMEQGFVVVYAAKADIRHIHDENWSQVRRRFYREGQAAKWIGVLNRRDLPVALVQEARRTAGDLRRAAREGKLLTKTPEILRFRWEKLRGTCAGVLDGAAMDNPLKRERLFFDRRSRAVVVRGPRDAAYVDIELPEIRPGDVLIRVAFEGVCGTDLDIYHGSLGYYRTGLARYPIVPGHEFSGTVVAAGPRVENVAEGDLVVAECIQGCGDCGPCQRGNAIGCSQRAEVGVMGRDGGYSEYVVVPGRFVHRIPPEVSLRAACLCEPTAVVLKALRRLDASTHGARGVLRHAVIGAGPIGHLAAKVLSLRGESVTTFDRNEGRLSVLKEAGIAVSTDLAALADFDILIEATGDVGALHSALSKSRAGATLLLLGFPYAEVPFNFESIVGSDKSVIGSVGSSGEDFEEALKILARLSPESMLSEPLPLAEFSRAWELSESGAGVKTLLRVDSTAR
ncbi:MAG: alcohol dehydrogenase catalytic domain-containing protein [Elusimicrobiota bacterium]|jgi:2-desacetyl-2-hydroxyethyl bacteriochlorophyllide A dehydrogenase